MRKRITFTAAGLAVATAAAFAGVSVAGGGTGGDTRELAAPIAAEPITARDAGPKFRAGGGATIQYFFAQTATVPPEGEGAVQAIRCPRKAGEPIAAGARTAEGIVVSYLSRVNTQGNAPARTYFVGVDDNSSTNDPGSGALVEVQCAKGLRVK